MVSARSAYSILMAIQDLEILSTLYSGWSFLLPVQYVQLAHCYMPGAMLLIHENVAKTTELSFNTTSSSSYALDCFTANVACMKVHSSQTCHRAL